MSCDVHPYATGGEIKTIGLFPVEGETREETYARWALSTGRKCICGPKCQRCTKPSPGKRNCPYAADVHNDSEQRCNCCDNCAHECAMDI